MKNPGTLLAITIFLSTFPVLSQTPAAAIPAAPTAQTAPADPLPPADPKYFTAKTPTMETVNSFVTALWGYDSNRLWRIMAIQNTAASGVSKVTVFVTDKGPNAKIQSTSFYTLPDGQHAIGESSGVIPFGANPFAETREMLKIRADGATRGATSKDFMLVEFADLQCPHCKEAQATMDNLVKDFPNARVVFQLFPLVDIHSSAAKAAAYGICVQKQSNDAFFKYSAGVFDTQDALTPTTDDTVLKGAVTRAGLDPTAIAACADTPATKAVVAADIKLADDASVDQTPLLSVNGRMLPVGQLPYEVLKQIIVYQAKLDGVSTGASADILAPKAAPLVLADPPK